MYEVFVSTYPYSYRTDALAPCRGATTMGKGHLHQALPLIIISLVLLVCARRNMAHPKRRKKPPLLPPGSGPEESTWPSRCALETSEECAVVHPPPPSSSSCLALVSVPCRVGGGWSGTHITHMVEFVSRLGMPVLLVAANISKSKGFWVWAHLRLHGP